MTELAIKIDTDRLTKAMLQVPDRLAANMRNAVSRSVAEIARSARSHAPKAFSTLTNSINDVMVSDYEGIVAPGVDYASAVEHGTGPQGMPPVDAIEDWIRVRNIEPREPGMTHEDIAFVIARSIATRGTPAQPYMQPALEDNRARAERRINAAIDAALQGSQSGRPS